MKISLGFLSPDLTLTAFLAGIGERDCRDHERDYAIKGAGSLTLVYDGR